MKFSKRQKIILFIFPLPIFILLFVYLANYEVRKAGIGSIYSMDEVPAKQVALVLGAKVYEDGRMSDMFRDRVDVAVMLYGEEKVEKILVSGDHGSENYDEVNAAKEYLLQHGVSGKDIFLDHAGFDTYDSVYRARDVFQVESLIIVSQEYHLPRALYIANNLGLDAVGASADLHSYGGQDYRDLREVFTVVKAWLDVLFRAKPKYLGNSIPISGEGFSSWD